MTFINYFPVIGCSKNYTDDSQKPIKYISNVICQDFFGIESYLLRAISSKMNFTFQLHLTTPDSMWTDMVRSVNKRDMDLAIGGTCWVIHNY